MVVWNPVREPSRRWWLWWWWEGRSQLLNERSFNSWNALPSQSSMGCDPLFPQIREDATRLQHIQVFESCTSPQSPGEAAHAAIRQLREVVGKSRFIRAATPCGFAGFLTTSIRMLIFFRCRCSAAQVRACAASKRWCVQYGAPGKSCQPAACRQQASETAGPALR